jgi:hypothetical protein
MKQTIFLFILCACFGFSSQAQSILPAITVKNISGKIIVSWRNEYNLPVATITIQRSYDSLKNYSSIGSVLNPQNKENGYADATPPYNKMYYRLFIAFEGGSYIITQPVRPVKEGAAPTVIKTADGRDSIVNTVDRYPWQVNPLLDSTIQIPPLAGKPAITYPSKRVFTSRDNSIVLHLPDAATKKYSLKFFNENEEMVFELTKLQEEFLILEKVNFVRSGWYHFELYDNGELVEKNKFFVPKDARKVQ